MNETGVLVLFALAMLALGFIFGPKSSGTWESCGSGYMQYDC
jgi:hypothetical protein